MKIYYSNTSPYSRKVRMVVLEKGLENQVESILINPFAEDKSNLTAANPLGKIPVLILEDESALFDSPVICHYLDSLNNEPQLIPANEDKKWKVLRWEALCDGMTDAMYNLVMERKRPENKQSTSSIANWSGEIIRTLEALETSFHELDIFSLNNKGEELTLAHLALASAIGYLDFRLPTILYSSECPQVAACPKVLTWYESFKTRPAMQETRPYDA